MKRIISILLAMMLILSVTVMAGCNKSEKKTDGSSDSSASGTSSAAGAVSVPEGAEPIATTAQGNATGYTKLDKDENGRVTRNYTYDSLGKLQGSLGYEYDDNDFVTKEIHYNADGAVTAQITFERDENGFETKRTTMDAQGNIKSTIVTEHDEEGNSIRTKYDADGNVIG